MPPKFQPGDLARIGGRHTKLPWPDRGWLRVGRIVQIVDIIDVAPGRHLLYLIAGRRGRPPAVLRSDQLRTLDDRMRRPRRDGSAAKE